MSKQKRNHKLINYLTDHKKIDMVSVNKTHVICTLSSRFMPSDVQPLCDAVGQWPIPQRRGNSNYITFERYPKEENGN